MGCEVVEENSEVGCKDQRGSVTTRHGNESEALLVDNTTTNLVAFGRRCPHSEMLGCRGLKKTMGKQEGRSKEKNFLEEVSSFFLLHPLGFSLYRRFGVWCSSLLFGILLQYGILLSLMKLFASYKEVQKVKSGSTPLHTPIYLLPYCH